MVAAAAAAGRKDLGPDILEGEVSSANNDALSGPPNYDFSSSSEHSQQLSRLDSAPSSSRLRPLDSSDGDGDGPVMVMPVGRGPDGHKLYRIFAVSVNFDSQSL